MKRNSTLSMVAALAALMAFSATATAEDAAKKKPTKKEPEATATKDERASAAYRRPAQVKGFVQRRGGYSYAAQDSINTYGDSQSKYSNYSLFRNNDFGRQTNFGPFDSDFFFDSGISPRGGFSPYQN